MSRGFHLIEDSQVTFSEIKDSVFAFVSTFVYKKFKNISRMRLYMYVLSPKVNNSDRHNNFTRHMHNWYILIRLNFQKTVHLSPDHYTLNTLKKYDWYFKIQVYTFIFSFRFIILLCMTAMLVAMSDPLPSATLPPIAGGIIWLSSSLCKKCFSYPSWQKNIDEAIPPPFYGFKLLIYLLWSIN